MLPPLEMEKPTGDSFLRASTEGEPGRWADFPAIESILVRSYSVLATTIMAQIRLNVKRSVSEIWPFPDILAYIAYDLQQILGCLYAPA